MSEPSEVEHGFGVFPHRGLELVDGQGARLRTGEGRTFVDAGGASYGTANVGHSHPRLDEAIDEAQQGLLHASRTFANPERSRLVARLRELVGPWADRVFLSNSGTEAVEAAIKAALVHADGSRLVAFEHAFHGRSLGALAATHEPRYREPFGDRLGETTFVPYGDLDALEEALGSDVAAVIVEPVQGEAGVRVPPEGFLAGVVERAREAGALSIVDEVQTGLGRTGHDLAIHRRRSQPDLVCLAKSLAGGLRLGATIQHERWPELGKGRHGTTFGGSPVACAAANAVLDVLDEHELADRARRRGAQLVDELAALDDPLVRDVRSRGLMIGVHRGAAHARAASLAGRGRAGATRRRRRDPPAPTVGTRSRGRRAGRGCPRGRTREGSRALPAGLAVNVRARATRCPRWCCWATWTRCRASWMCGSRTGSCTGGARSTRRGP
jgi:acetylornithine/LysW-gamma-L-lysine aminotransferase